jgi:hypothetical protein
MRSITFALVSLRASVVPLLSLSQRAFGANEKQISLAIKLRA